MIVLCSWAAATGHIHYPSMWAPWPGNRHGGTAGWQVGGRAGMDKGKCTPVVREPVAEANVHKGWERGWWGWGCMKNGAVTPRTEMWKLPVCTMWRHTVSTSWSNSICKTVLWPIAHEPFEWQALLKTSVCMCVCMKRIPRSSRWGSAIMRHAGREGGEGGVGVRAKKEGRRPKSEGERQSESDGDGLRARDKAPEEQLQELQRRCGPSPQA